MKILHLIPSLSLSYGGPANQVFHLCKLLAENGYEVSIVTSSYLFDSFYMNELQDLVRIEVLPSYCGRLHFSPGLRSALQMRYGHYDLLHLWSYWNYQNIVGRSFCRSRNIPYVLSALNNIPIVLRSHGKKFLFDFIFGRKILQGASRLVAITASEVEHYRMKGIQDKMIRMIPLCVDLAEIPPGIERGSFRTKHGLRDEPMILFLGRLHKIKGLDFLLEAVRRIVFRIRDLKVVLVGPDDGFLSEIRHLVKLYELEGAIVIAGPVYGSGKWHALADADIFVLPSMTEGMAHVPLEAGLCGLPIVVTENCGLPEIASFGAGIIVRYGDVVGLETALLRLLTDKDLRKSMGEKAKQMVLENFTWQCVYPKYLEMYHEVLKEKQSSNCYR